jgi:hypothetical protein
MWIFWVLLCSGLVLVIVEAGSLVRETLHGVGAHGGRELGKWLRGGSEPTPTEFSSGQARFLAALRVAGCIGLVAIWGALVYVFIHLGGSHLAQLWQDSAALPLSLYYTYYALASMRTQNFVRHPWFASVSLLVKHAIAMFFLFLVATVAIAALIEHS